MATKPLVLSPLVLAVFYLAFGSSLSLAAQSDEERRMLEQQLTELESQIAEHETTVESYKKQGKTLQKEIDRLNAEVGKINLQIKAVNLTLKKLDGDIVENKSKIETIEGSIDLNKSALTNAIRKVYESESATLLLVMLKHSSLSAFAGDINNLFDVQDSLSVTLKRITGLRGQLLEEKEALEVKRGDVVALKAYRDSQKTALNNTRSDKSSLLKTTKGQESRYQEILKAIRKTAAQIRSRIFELLGGGELTFEEAYKFAKFAEQATGVRAAMILAVLDRESALGQNIGKCNYKTAMAPGPPKSKRDDVTPFLALTKELGINPDTVTVSCANKDGFFGGAMGPAQFIPTTWMLYRDKIADLTGSNPPSPWRHADAFVGTAIYLKDSGAAKATIAQERQAAARYYAGGRWRTYLWTYGDRVVKRAQQFQQDIDILNS